MSAEPNPVPTSPDLVEPDRLGFDQVPPKFGDMWYSMRRYYVDEFFSRRVALLDDGSRIADIGGSKRKRGQFDIEREVESRRLRVTYINLSPASEPDVLADAADIPLDDGAFDAAILGEVIEHLPDPVAALREAARLLRPGGVFLATAPFLHRLHDDPIDVGRYTPAWWRDALTRAGFSEIEVEPQGRYFSVLSEMVRALACHADVRDAWPKATRDPAMGFLRWLRDTAGSLDRNDDVTGDAFFRSFTTGFGVHAVRHGEIGA